MCAPAAKMYHPRNPEVSPFFRLVREYFDKFERVYYERFQSKYGCWRPVIHTAIDKFLNCGELREGFARMRCPEPVLSLRRKAISRPPPAISRVAEGEPSYDCGYFECVCI